MTRALIASALLALSFTTPAAAMTLMRADVGSGATVRRAAVADVASLLPRFDPAAGSLRGVTLEMMSSLAGEPSWPAAAPAARMTGTLAATSRLRALRFDIAASPRWRGGALAGGPGDASTADATATATQRLETFLGVGNQAFAWDPTGEAATAGAGQLSSVVLTLAGAAVRLTYDHVEPPAYVPPPEPEPDAAMTPDPRLTPKAARADRAPARPPAARLTPAAVSTVPEPSAWATLIIGFGLIGLTLRRRRRAIERATPAWRRGGAC